MQITNVLRRLSQIVHRLVLLFSDIHQNNVQCIEFVQVFYDFCTQSQWWWGGGGGGGEMGLPRKIVSSDSQNGTRENLSILKIIENTWPIKYWKHHMLFSQFSVTSSYNSRNIIYKNKLILFCKSFNVTMSALFCFKRKKRCNLSGKVN